MDGHCQFYATLDYSLISKKKQEYISNIIIYTCSDFVSKKVSNILQILDKVNFCKMSDTRPIYPNQLDCIMLLAAEN